MDPPPLHPPVTVGAWSIDKAWSICFQSPPSPQTTTSAESARPRFIPWLTRVELDVFQQALLRGQRVWWALIEAQCLPWLYTQLSSDSLDSIDRWSGLTANEQHRIQELLVKTACALRVHLTALEMGTHDDKKDLWDQDYWTLEEDERIATQWTRRCSDLRLAQLNPSQQRRVSTRPAKTGGSAEIFPGLGSLQYMFKTLDRQARRLNGKISMASIQTLLRELQPQGQAVPPGSKWANDDRVGQAELYPHLERVIEELKNLKEHSYPFLQKVNKRDAPDYFDVIKNPMDLGTMTKKLKMSQYNSRAEVEADLELIWSNCLYYNSDPSSVYRIHAVKMREKTRELMQSVPAIEIKTRAEMEADGYDSDQIAYAGDDGTAEEDDASNAHDGGVSEKEESLEEESALDNHRGVGDQPPMIEAMELTSDESANVELERSKREESLVSLQAVSFSDFFSTDESKAKVDQEQEFGVLTSFGTELEELMSECIVARTSQVPLPFAERLALLRTSEEMGEYELQCALYRHQKQSNLIGGKLAQGVQNEDRPNWISDTFFFPEMYHLMGSVSEGFLDENGTFFPVSPIQSDHVNETKSMVVDSRSLSKSARLTLNNIKAISECRLLEQKVLYSLQKLTGSLDVAPTTVNKGMDRVISADSLRCDFLRATVPPDSHLDETHAQDLLRRTIGLSVAAAGFDAVSSFSVHVLTEMTIQCLQLCGRVFKQYSDFQADRFSFEEMLYKTFVANAHFDMNSMRAHLKKEPLSLKRKLARRLARLNVYYSAVTTPQDEPSNEDDMILDDEFAFLNGNFGTLAELDDYLGLKSMGIDGGVPEQLWRTAGVKSPLDNRRLRSFLVQSYGSSLGLVENGDSGFQYPLAERFPSVTSPASHIGLLHDFISKKLAESGGGGLLEDEYLPPIKSMSKKKKRKSPKKEKPSRTTY